jgi:ABC-type nitrate/sulfonate/bicarbonate transport system substrate-binding protein
VDGAADTLRVGLVSRTFFSVPLWAAQRQGFFVREGLRVETTIFNSINRITEGLKAGALHIGLATPEGVIQDVEAGGGLRIVAGNTGRLTHFLIAQKKHRRIEDLRGGVIGVASPDEGTAFVVQEILAAHGLRYPDDYSLAPVGGAPARWDALREGRIDAGLQSIPLNYMAEDAGFPSLGDAAAYVPAYQFTTVNSHAAWAGAHGEELVRFLTALLLGTRWMYDSRDAAVALTAEEMELPRDYAERGWRYFTSQRIIPTDGAVNPAGMAKVIEIMGRAGTLTVTRETRPEKYLDLSFLSRARQASGAG